MHYCVTSYTLTIMELENFDKGYCSTSCGTPGEVMIGAHTNASINVTT